MSIQDDHYDLEAHLRSDSASPELLKAYRRIWYVFCNMEEQQENLINLRQSVRDVLRLSRLPHEVKE